MQNCPTRIGQLKTKSQRSLEQCAWQEATSMGLSRREFFKVGTGSAAALLLGFDARPVLAQAKELKIARTTETRSTCPYCSVSCGVIIHTLEIKNDRRLLKPQVRRPGSTQWEDISWDKAYEEIARHIKKTRDETFVDTDANGKTVNRCEGIAFNGGCTDTNEFNYLVVKTMRSLGVCYIENQARV
jgi:formate dehydrogenase major subunit